MSENGNGKSAIARVQHVAAQGKAAASGAGEAVFDYARQHPYQALAAAFGVGYVIGGGLFSKSTGRVLRLGVKLATVPMVQGVLLDVAEAALGGVLEQARKTGQPAPAEPSAPGAPRA
jgi:hypothetical protein